MDNLKDRLTSALKNLELLTLQLRETQDYSQQSELTFFLKELVEEQITNESSHEDSRYSTSAPR